ncbi:MAG: zinc metallopeptidase [Candidatus Caldatribacteriota bacterium]|nr:zinc metallopeptidase [Candidatus Caldatribacteriota bacterium]
MFFFDGTFFILIPAILLTLYAQFKVKTIYAKYLKISAKNGMTGIDVAKKLLQENGLSNIKIELLEGKLSDHYDSQNKKLGLSREVCYSRSIAAQGIAAHEIGHAIQDLKKYFPLAIRNNLVPITNIGSHIAVPLFLIGFLFSLPGLMEIGIITFSLVVLFQIITLPVEFDASKRAVKMLSKGSIISDKEAVSIKKVLDAAALTYIASTAIAVMQLLRLVVLRNRRG